MAYEAVVLADSPVLYWRLGDTSGVTATDSSGNGRNGTYTNTPTLAQTGLLTNNSDKSVSFTAASSHYATRANGDLLVTDTNYLVIEAWVVPTATSVAAGTFTIASWSPAGGQKNVLQIKDGKPELINTDGASTKTLTGPSTLSAGTTYHLVGRFAYLNSVGYYQYLYVNGVQVATQAAGGNLDVRSSSFDVGRNSVSGAYFDGTIDEVAIYSAGDLSAERIWIHYTVGNDPGKPRPFTPVNATVTVPAPDPLTPGATSGGTGPYQSAVIADLPLLYWRLGETSGNVINDSSGNGNNGVYLNTPTLGVSGLVTGDANTAIRVASTSESEEGGRTSSGLTSLNAVYTAFSVEAWFKITTQHHDFRTQHIAGFDGDHMYIEMNVFDESEESGFGLVLQAYDFNAPGVAQYLDILPNTRYHAVFTDNGFTQKLYVNGAMVDSIDSGGGDTISGDYFWVGRAETYSYADGVFDEVAFYNYALTAGQVLTHYSLRDSQEADDESGNVLRSVPTSFLPIR